MAGNLQRVMEVSCCECSFERIVRPEDGVLPSDVVVEHGKKMRHKLEVSPLSE